MRRVKLAVWLADAQYVDGVKALLALYPSAQEVETFNNRPAGVPLETLTMAEQFFCNILSVPRYKRKAR